MPEFSAMLFCSAASTAVSLGSLRKPMNPSGSAVYAMYSHVNMEMQPSKPARKIRFIKIYSFANCDSSRSPSLHNKNATKRRENKFFVGPAQSHACARARDGSFRQHYQNITTY